MRAHRKKKLNQIVFKVSISKKAGNNDGQCYLLDLEKYQMSMLDHVLFSNSHQFAPSDVYLNKAIWRTAKSPSAVDMNVYFLIFYQP
jgi:hypothetical protein